MGDLATIRRRGVSQPLRYARPAATPLLAGVLIAAWVGLHLAMELTLGDPDPARLAGGTIAVVGLGAGFTAFLHQRGGRLRRRRDMASLFIWIAVAVALGRGLAPLTPAATWLPLAAFVLPLERRFDRSVPLVATGFLAGAMAPISPTLAAVVATHGLILTYAVRDANRSAWHWWAPVTALTVVGGIVAGGATQLLTAGRVVTAMDLANPLVGAAASGAVVVSLGIGLAAVVDRMLGNLSRTQLLELSDLRNPLLKRIASRAPGTWQHSRMMANLAESAAHAANADALLVRVGAYYHDLGKADEPGHFIENTGPHQPNLHDALSPRESAAKIVDHVREGVRRGREAQLPEDIIDFMHTHHGTGRVEYFWQRALEEADSIPPDEAEFTYPGEPPRTRETAILAIVDAVEAAARTLQSANQRSVQRMIHQILFTKIESGQLDRCGLSAADLHGIIESLIASLLAASHDRVPYPWQEADADDAPPPPPPQPRLRPDASDGHVPLEDEGSSPELRIIRPKYRP